MKPFEDTPPDLLRGALEASIYKESFYEFVKAFWDIIIPETPVWNWHLPYLCEELQRMAERVFQNLPKEYDMVINIPPGSTKSTILSRMFPAWCWTRMPTARCICGSYNDDLAMDLSRSCRNIVQSEKYIRLFGDIELAEDQNTKHYFLNKHGGARIAVGTGAGITGFHAHFLIIDDPLNPKEAASDAELKEANLWMSETLSTRKVDRAITPTILIMQRLHEDDPAAHLLEKGKEDGFNVRHINLPAEIDDQNQGEVRPRSLRKHYVDGLLDPIRLPRKVLKSARVELNEYGYACQFLQRPIPPGGGMFKIDRIEIEEKAPSKWKSLTRFWDKAGSKNKGAYTAGIKMGKDLEDCFWILDMTRGQWASDTRESIILQTAKIDGKKTVVGIEQEPGSGGLESAENTLRRLAGFRAMKIRPTGDKILRADPYSVQVNAGNVKMLKGAWNKEYLNELQFFPHSKYKDQVDASSGAFSLLTRARRAGGFR